MRNKVHKLTHNDYSVHRQLDSRQTKMTNDHDKRKCYKNNKEYVDNSLRVSTLSVIVLSFGVTGIGFGGPGGLPINWFT